MSTQMRDGSTVDDPRLGRLMQFDERSRAYAAVDVVSKPPRSYTWRMRPKVLGTKSVKYGLWIDQGGEGSCFPAGTFVRMADGSQKAIEDIRTLDEVVTAEGRTGRVLQTMVRASEELVRVRLVGHNRLVCTPEHPVLTQRGYVAAGELTSDDRVATTKFLPPSDGLIDVTALVKTTDLRGVIEGTVNTGGVMSKIAPLPSLLAKTPALGRLIGLYAAEGGTTANKVVFCFNVQERDSLVAETVDLIKTCFDAEARVQERPNNSLFVVLYGKTWRRLFERFVPGTSRHGDKHLSHWVTSGDPGYLNAILGGWLDGDGHRRRSNVMGVSSCKQLVLDMHAIAQALGMRPAFRHSKPVMNRHAKTRQDRWELEIAEGTQREYKRQPQDDAAVWRKVRSVEPVEFSGWVYNFHVEGDESYVADGVGVHNCVGHGVVHDVALPPRVVTGLDNTDAVDVYHRAQQIDPWPGGAYPGAEEHYEGTSVLAGVKIGVEEGWFTGYRWAFGEDDLWQTVGRLGPAIIGIPWYEGMYSLNQHGYLVPSGRMVGHHCLVINGQSLKRGSYEGVNSWDSFGPFRIAREHLASLLSQGGEACIPIRA